MRANIVESRAWPESGARDFVVDALLLSASKHNRISPGQLRRISGLSSASTKHPNPSTKCWHRGTCDLKKVRCNESALQVFVSIDCPISAGGTRYSERCLFGLSNGRYDSPRPRACDCFILPDAGVITLPAPAVAGCSPSASGRHCRHGNRYERRHRSRRHRRSDRAKRSPHSGDERQRIF